MFLFALAQSKHLLDKNWSSAISVLRVGSQFLRDFLCTYSRKLSSAPLASRT